MHFGAILFWGAFVALAGSIHTRLKVMPRKK